ncbi:MAG: hypothetical protein DRH15_04365 [Deltaproteobacteria bacterium]|nr:MAG: hypothetical protein DRH15_04365 [Deltaproteobacteria bacterium]
MVETNQGPHPRERILDASEALFAEKGYEAVTIREIVKAAGCNVAAVNYYFGQKRNLYLEVFECRWIPRAYKIQESFRENLRKSGRSDVEGIIRAFAMAFLEGPFSEKERIRHSQLMAREIARPSEAFDLIAKKVMRPFVRELVELLRKALPAPVRDHELILILLSIFSQIIYFTFARRPVSLFTGKRYTSEFRENLCEHIVAFSLRGLGMGNGGCS